MGTDSDFPPRDMLPTPSLRFVALLAQRTADKVESHERRLSKVEAAMSAIGTAPNPWAMMSN